MVVFPKGAWYALDACADMGYQVIGMDWLHDPAEAVKIIGDRPVVLQGNADPGVLYGSHESITEVVTEMVKGFGWAERKKGWIVNLGHGMSQFLNRLLSPPLTGSQASPHLSTQMTSSSSSRRSTASPRPIDWICRNLYELP